MPRRSQIRLEVPQTCVFVLSRLVYLEAKISLGSVSVALTLYVHDAQHDKPYQKFDHA
jgi:hypothetical protein